MLTDRKEVIYSMKNKKVVYSEIAKEGLICYLDTRGKTNNNISKDKLLDLINNNNNAILSTFSFTNESGYVNNTLKFDGIKDYMAFTLIAGLSNYTIFLDINHIGDYNTTNPVFIHTSNFVIYKNNPNNLVKLEMGNYNQGAVWMEHDQTDFRKMAIVRNGTNLKIVIDDKDYISNNMVNPLANSGLNLGSMPCATRNGSIELNRIIIWNRALTETEILKVFK